MSVENFFFLNVLGEIQSVLFPLGPYGRGIFIRYDVVAGDDWEMVSGVNSGITQSANSGHSDQIVFNMPIEFTFKSTNIHGCKKFFPKATLTNYNSYCYRASNRIQLIWTQHVGN